jgi:Rap1a immunity proteins
VLALTQVGLAWGKDPSANTIMPGCRDFLNERPSFSAGQCLGIILGLARAVEVQSPRPFCIPDHVTNEQMVRVVVNYIDQRPEKMHSEFAPFVYDRRR